MTGSDWDVAGTQQSAEQGTLWGHATAIRTIISRHLWAAHAAHRPAVSCSCPVVAVEYH